MIRVIQGFPHIIIIVGVSVAYVNNTNTIFIYIYGELFAEGTLSGAVAVRE